MEMSVQELKHAVRLQEWSERVAACRSSGIGVKAWCAANGVALKTYYNWERQIVKAATRQYALTDHTQSGHLIRVDPNTMPDDDINAHNFGITIHHGESIISVPAGSSAEAIADLVKALNRHA